MNPALQNFLSVALPIMIAFVVVIWAAQSGTGRAFEGINKRLDDIVRRLDAIEGRLGSIAAGDFVRHNCGRMATRCPEGGDHAGDARDYRSAV